MEENTALLKSIHIGDATRKPKCIGDGWQEASLLPSSFCLFPRVFLILHNLFCGHRTQAAWKDITKVVRQTTWHRQRSQPYSELTERNPDSAINKADSLFIEFSEGCFLFF